MALPTFLVIGSLLGMVVGIYTAWRTAAFILGKVQKQRDKTEDR